MIVRMEDIARLCGVSKATVSRVINNKAEGVGEETRRRVQKVIDEMEYRPNLLARGIVTSKTRTIGLIIPSIINPFFPKIVRGVENYASERGYTVILGDTGDSEEKENGYISTFISKRVDGFILTTSSRDSLELCKKITRYDLPCVLLDRALRMPTNLPGVFIDNRYAASLACEELLQGGCSRIAFISGPLHLKTSKERLEGYESTLRKHGIPMKADLIKTGDFTFESGYIAAIDLKKGNVGFDAIMASNDVMAVGAIKAMKEYNLSVPDDVQIVGFDNIAMSEICDPPLTTVDQPTYEMGSLAAELLLNLIDGKKIQNDIYRLQPKLIVRRSTKNLSGEVR